MAAWLAPLSVALIAALAAAAHGEIEEDTAQVDSGCELSAEADSLNLLQTRMTTTRATAVNKSEQVGSTNSSIPPSTERKEDPNNLAHPTIFMLTVRGSPPNIARAERCLASCKSLGYVNVSTIEGIRFHKFYPSDREIAAQNWSSDRKANETSRANSEIFKVFEQDQPNVTYLQQKPTNKTRLPKDFKEVVSRSLMPGQVAVYLGHRRFWERVSLMTNGSWSLLLEDDTHLNVKPSVLADWLGRHRGEGPPSFVYLRPEGCNGRFWIPDLMGYAIQPQTARVLLANARADIPVDWAISHLVADKKLAGFCSEDHFIQSDPDWRSSTKSLMEMAAEEHESNEHKIG